MAQLTDIKRKIDELDGGTFQELCDAYLAAEGYKHPYSLGMKTGTAKTAKGNPDTYFKNESNKYIFVMYTTQKDGLVEKALKDFEKCFDSSKTGVSCEDITEIIFCHTCGRVTAGEDKALNDYCNDHGVNLILKGIDDLATDIYFKHKGLAKDFLGLSLDTGQIMSMEAFISQNDRKEISAPLGSSFIGREKELDEAVQLLKRKDILLLTGPAGIGKTRFALEVAARYSSEEECYVYVLKSNSLEIYDDLKTTIIPDKNYLLIVDDANELTGLHHVLELLEKINEKYFLKIILTVRDYAQRRVECCVSEYRSLKSIRLKKLSDEEIKKLLKDYYEISNEQYLERICDIAQGNTRLAMLAGKIADKSQNLNSIRDASSIYEFCYRKQLEVITGKEHDDLIKSAGILAFMERMHLDFLTRFSEVFRMIGISEDEFIGNIKLLHDEELADICNDKAVKISDQTFGNFLLKYVFVDKKIISLAAMIEAGFHFNRLRTVNACNVLLRVFSDSKMEQFVCSEIETVWDKIQGTNDFYPDFLESFHTVRPVETLLYIQDKISAIEPSPYMVTLEDVEKNKNRGGNDSIIKILAGFSNNKQLPEAVELLLQYYIKCPELIAEIYQTFTGAYGIDTEYYYTHCYDQLTVVRILTDFLKKNLSDNMIILYLNVAEELLKISFSPAKSGRGNQIIVSYLTMVYSEEVGQYRKILWESLADIYRLRKFNSKIEDILFQYGAGSNHKEADPRLYFFDLACMKVFFEKLFSPDVLKHCIVAAHLAQFADETAKQHLTPYLKSKKYIYYEILSKCSLDLAGEYDWDYERTRLERKKMIQKFIEDCSEDEFELIMSVVSEGIAADPSQEYNISEGVEILIEAFESKPELFERIVCLYFQNNTPGRIGPCLVVNTLYKLFSPDHVWNILNCCSFSEQSNWIWEYYSQYPAEAITRDTAKNLLEFLSKPFDKTTQSYRHSVIEEMEKYKKVWPTIVLDVSRCLLKQSQNSRYLYDIFFSRLFHDTIEEEDKIWHEFEDDKLLLKEIYLKGVQLSCGYDYKGKFFRSFLSRGIYDVVDALMMLYFGSDRNARLDDYYAKALKPIWLQDNYLELATKIYDLILERCDYWKRLLFMKEFLMSSTGCNIRGQVQNWIILQIEEHSEDDEYIVLLFEVVAELDADIRHKAIMNLITLNDSFDLFQKLDLESKSYSGMGSLIPYMESRVKFLESLLPDLSGLKYLKHKRYIQKQIDRKRDGIRSEEIREMLEDY